MRKRFWSILLVLCMVLTLVPVFSTQADAAVIGDDYPYKGQSSGMDPWLFVKGNCTSFVAWRLNNTNGVEFNDYYGGVEWGNASNWGYAAQNLNIPVDMNPAVGSVAWNSFGHVAWVAEVKSNTVIVEEYNWDGDHAYHKYERAISHYTGFIHIKDLSTDNFCSYVDSLTGGEGCVSFKGWTYNESDPTRSIHVDVYVDNVRYVFEANKYRPDVDNAYHTGQYHGFDDSVTGLSAGNHVVKLYAIDYKRGTYVQIKGETTITVAPVFVPDSNSLPSDFYGPLVAYPWVHLTANGSNVELCSELTWEPKQMWHYVEQADGSYKITNEYNGLVLGTYQGKASSGANVGVYADTGKDTQRWYIHDNGNDTYLITLKQDTSLALDVTGAATSGGTNIEIYNRHGGDAQKFLPHDLEVENVTYVKPDKPAASTVSTSEAKIGEPTTIQWTKSPKLNYWDTRSYTLTIKDSDGNTVLNKSGLTDTSYTYTFPSAGNYTAQITAVNTQYEDYKTEGSERTIAVKSDLVITTQPADYTGKVNSTATFSVSAEGDGLTYQWQYSDDNGSSWMNSKSTADTATCKITAARDGRLYRCIVSDGSNSVTSDSAKIVVKPAVTTQPKNYSGVVGDTAVFTVKASGANLSYQWQYKDPGGTWKNSKSTTNTATCKITAARDGRQYRCKITGNGMTVTSSTVKITVMPAITAQPKDYTGAVGGTASFTVKATGVGLTYQWQYSSNNGKTWTDSSTNISATATCRITAARDGRLYRCIVMDANGNTVTSSTAAVIVK